MLWLYLDFFALQLDALDSSKAMPENELTPAPEVIVIVDPKKNEVVQMNAYAQQQGIRLGMGLATALSLHHNVNVVAYKAELEQQKLQHIAQLLYQFTADIALCFPHGLYLRIDTMLRLYHGLPAYWQHLQSVLSDIGYQYHYATGTTPLMAKLLAQAEFNRVSNSEQALKAALYQLPLACLELEPKVQDALARVGVKQTEQLLQLPLKEMAKRFDIHLLNYMGKLTGEFKHGLLFFQPPAEFCADIELLFEIENSQILQHPIKRLLIQLEQFLSLRGLVAQLLTFQLKYRYDEFLELSVSRAQGEYKMEKWLSLVKLKLESVKLAEPVVTIVLYATKLRALNTDTGDLFHAQTPAVSPDELVAMLQAKLGDEKVQGLLLQDQHHPQYVTRFCDAKQVITNDMTPVPSQSRIKPNYPYQLRPSLFTAKAQALKDKVTILSGPERVQTSWWNEDAIYRDYFVARNTKGRICWVYRTPQKEWFIQGYFS